MPFSFLTNDLDKLGNPYIKLRTLLIRLVTMFVVPLLLSYLPHLIQKGQFVMLGIFVAVITCLVAAYYLTTIDKTLQAAYLSYISTSLAVAVSIAGYGFQGNSQIFIPILMIFIFIYFDSEVEWLWCGIFNFCTFLIPFLLVDANGEIIKERPLDIDYYINVGFAVTTCAALSYIVMSTLKDFMSQKDQAFHELKIKNKLINEKNEEMNLFTSMASHDLKTPVRTIKGFIGLLEKSGEVKSIQATEYLRLANSGVEQLDRLIEGISNFKQLGKEESQFNYKPTKEILSTVTNLINPANDENIIIEYRGLPDLKVLHSHLYQIFQNLIQNGLKYNKNPVKKINLNSIRTRDQVLITIADNGIGVDPAYVDYIFEPFKKLHSSKDYQSTGLGLWICKKIVGLYNGNIYLDQSTDQGSTFVLALPIDLINEKTTHLNP